MTGRVLVRRGDEVESVHRVSGVLVGLEEGTESSFGDPDRLAFWRSSMKPFQALPLVEDGAAEAFGVSEVELALCCASHVGSPAHVRIVAGLLDRLGLTPDRLHCGPHPPFDDESAREVVRRGESFTRLHNNCSGKHAGMLALALHHGWPLDGYAELDHPVQRRVRRSLARWLDVEPDGLGWGVDGCGVPTPYLTLRQMARAFARLVRAVGTSDAPTAVVGAMTAHPDLVSGEGRPVTRIMEAGGGRLLAKEGAEGVQCLAGLGEGWGLAVKVEDGARRAATPAALEALLRAGLLTAGERSALEDLREREIENTRGETVGRLVPDLRLRTTVVSGRT